MSSVTCEHWGNSNINLNLCIQGSRSQPYLFLEMLKPEWNLSGIGFSYGISSAWNNESSISDHRQLIPRHVYWWHHQGKQHTDIQYKETWQTLQWQFSFGIYIGKNRLQGLVQLKPLFKLAKCLIWSVGVPLRATPLSLGIPLMQLTLG